MSTRATEGSSAASPSALKKRCIPCRLPCPSGVTRQLAGFREALVQGIHLRSAHPLARGPRCHRLPRDQRVVHHAFAKDAAPARSCRPIRHAPARSAKRTPDTRRAPGTLRTLPSPWLPAAERRGRTARQGRKGLDRKPCMPRPYANSPWRPPLGRPPSPHVGIPPGISESRSGPHGSIVRPATPFHKHSAAAEIAGLTM
jgi:hypothetical protein